MYESRAYDNENGDPVVVLVTTGTHDVSRLVNLLAGSRLALCEHMDLSGRILRQVKRYNGGRAALKLLASHGGPDFTETGNWPPQPGDLWRDPDGHVWFASTHGEPYVELRRADGLHGSPSDVIVEQSPLTLVHRETKDGES